MGDVLNFRDRYDGKYPNPETICLGQCDGMGCFPLSRNDRNPKYASLWDEAEKKNPSDDGWHIVRCPDCEGTGKKKMNEPPENKYADILESGYQLSDPGEDAHYFVFNAIGPEVGVKGKEIARIDLRDGTVTYDAPDAGREAAKIFWEVFAEYISDYIQGQIKKEREKE